MTTTSLSMSRKLAAAGFWKDTRVDWWLVDGVAYFRPQLHGDVDIPAATLDDLLTALGLDKPWGERSLSGWDYADVEDRIFNRGLTPDVLAQVWLDTKGTP